MGAPQGLGAWLHWLAVHPVTLIWVGGGGGSVARYYIGRAIDQWAMGTLPWGTFVVNICGSFILGVLGLLILERLPPNFRWVYLLLGTGFCGGFTTFSTFEWETFKLVRDGSFRLALVNVVGSVSFGFLGIVLAVFTVFGLFGRQIP